MPRALDLRRRVSTISLAMTRVGAQAARLTHITSRSPMHRKSNFTAASSVMTRMRLPPSILIWRSRAAMTWVRRNRVSVYVQPNFCQIGDHQPVHHWRSEMQDRRKGSETE
jgi:hypothetical protein